LFFIYTKKYRVLLDLQLFYEECDKLACYIAIGKGRIIFIKLMNFIRKSININFIIQEYYGFN